MKYANPHLPKPLLLAFLGTALFCSCQPNAPTPPPAPTAVSVAIKDTLRLSPSDRTYAATKAAVNQRRQALNTAYEAGRITLDSVRQAFTAILLDDIIPYWYGPSWRRVFVIQNFIKTRRCSRRFAIRRVPSAALQTGLF